jgi:aromatic-L-amino-acid decarboxylase
VDFRDEAHRVADLAADYLQRVESYDVVPKIAPGDVKAQLPPSPPHQPESMDAILADYRKIIEPNITHWQHPMFLAYFPSIASEPAILGEWLAATLNSNVMLWRNAPASTELEQLVVSWLRQMLGLPDTFDGMLTDTASISSLLSLVAARHAVPGLHAREEGLSGKRPLKLYASTEAHSSIEKAAIVAGIGRAGIRRIATDDAYRMRPDLLQEAIEADRAEGDIPFAVVATLGTTSSTSVDPCAAIADICAKQRLWLHVDAAYAGIAAILPDLRHHFVGWERADSIVVNPHKWMFTPFDASLLLFRSPEAFRDAFSLVPEYLKTPESDAARNFNEYGIQLGRRFRALKLWMQIRAYGVDGIARHLREHLSIARAFAGWIEADANWELSAPMPFATVCYRFRGDDAKNEAILDRVNASGRAYISHTRLGGRYVLRASFGNPRQTEDHAQRLWNLLREAASAP